LIISAPSHFLNSNAALIRIRVYVWLYLYLIKRGFIRKGNTAESQAILVNAVTGDGILQLGALTDQTGEQIGVEFGASPAKRACPSTPIRALAQLMDAAGIWSRAVLRRNITADVTDQDRGLALF
jgi:hypothetical protein